MGWRDRLDVILKDCWEGIGCSDEARDAALLAMPPADRIALARELLEGTGHCAIDEDDLADREAEAYGSGLEDGRNRQ